MNDGFCDVCLVFKEHENLKQFAAKGILFCEECQNLMRALDKEDLIIAFRKALGIEVK